MLSVLPVAEIAHSSSCTATLQTLFFINTIQLLNNHQPPDGVSFYLSVKL